MDEVPPTMKQNKVSHTSFQPPENEGQKKFQEIKDRPKISIAETSKLKQKKIISQLLYDSTYQTILHNTLPKVKSLKNATFTMAKAK